jgi:hypothetical protein
MVRMENPNDALGENADDPKNHGHQRTLGQKVIAAAIMIGVVLYLSLVVSGTIQRDNRLGAAEFGALIVAAAVVGMLLRPDIVDRLQRIDIAGIKLDLGEVKERQIEVQKSQQEQRRVLEDLRFAMRILITQPERDHLQNLHQRRTTNYTLKGTLREELRRLRAMGLIKMRDGKWIGGLPEKMPFDLSDYLTLTPDGAGYVERFSDQVAEQTKEATTAA